MAELVDRRILGAIRAIDAVTGTAIRGPLKLTGPGLAFQRTRSGTYAIVGATGLEAHLVAFDAPPTLPAAETLPFDFKIEDIVGNYLPAAAAIRLPRRWDPANGVRDAMVPIDVALAPSAGRDLSPSWAGVLANIVDQSGQAIRGALVEVFAAGSLTTRLGWSLTNERGLALVSVPGLPSLREVENDPNRPDDNQIVTAETATDIRVRVHADRRWPVDPLVLAAGGAGIRTAIRNALALTPGRTDRVALTMNLS